MSEATAFSEPTWCILELFGHNVIAGQVSEVTVAGAPMLRVDVPETDGQPAYTKFFGAAAIYSITPAGEAEAKAAVERLKVRPVAAWIVPDPPKQLPAPEEEEEVLELTCCDCDDRYVFEGEDATAEKRYMDEDCGAWLCPRCRPMPF